MWSTCYLAAVLLATACKAQYAFNYSNTHGDHMVLQRDVNATVWGFGTLFAPISVTLISNTSSSGQPAINVTVNSIVDSMGIWRVRLPPQGAGGPFAVLGSSATTNESFVINDVMFGDVIICGGQSNMAYGMGGILNSSELVAASAQRPWIRIYSPQYSAQNVSQAQEVLEFAINWTVADPDHVPGFSAVCYLSAATVYDRMNGIVPLGLIDVSVGGTAIQLWIPPAYLGECLSGMLWWEHWPWSLSCWYNGMVHPLTVGPTDMKLFLWDQGENNVGDNEFYSCAFPLMINKWRQEFMNPAAPFYFVQLPAYLNQNDTQLSSFRQTQLTGLTVPNTGFVVTADDGDAYDGSIHNRDKAVVGGRMGNLLLREVYGYNDVQPYFPQYGSAHAVTNGQAVTVTVTPNGNVIGGLSWREPDYNSNSSWCPTARGVEALSCDWFGVQTSDGGWYNATASISADGQSVVLTATVNATGLSVVATRNGYADWPVVNVYNSAGLPLMPWGPTPVYSAVVLDG